MDWRRRRGWEAARLDAEGEGVVVWISRARGECDQSKYEMRMDSVNTTRRDQGGVQCAVW
jgi:hypothetical protein